MKQHSWNVHLDTWNGYHPTKTIKVVTENRDIGEAVTVAKAYVLEVKKGNNPVERVISSIDYAGEVVTA